MRRRGRIVEPYCSSSVIRFGPITGAHPGVPQAGQSGCSLTCHPSRSSWASAVHIASATKRGAYRSRART
jgi:hypothetical protein